MKLFGLLFCMVTLLFVGYMVGPGHAADLSKAKGTVDNIRQADPPQASTGTVKGNPVGQPVTDYKPAAAPSFKIKEPPPPPPPKPAPKK